MSTPENVECPHCGLQPPCDCIELDGGGRPIRPTPENVDEPHYGCEEAYKHPHSCQCATFRPAIPENVEEPTTDKEHHAHP